VVRRDLPSVPTRRSSDLRDFRQLLDVVDIEDRRWNRRVLARGLQPLAGALNEHVRFVRRDRESPKTWRHLEFFWGRRSRRLILELRGIAANDRLDPHLLVSGGVPGHGETGGDQLG